jgi:hypothetical protein
MKRKALRAATFVVFGLCVWMIAANVLGDETAARVLAEKAVRAKAGCGDECKITGLHGTKGMIDVTITYDFDGVGQRVVTCRRAFIVAGDYACTAEP